jgi:hypothetical protein
MRGFGNLMFPLWFALLGGSFVFLDMGASILFLVFPPFLGALVYLWLVGFNHHSFLVHSWKPLILWGFRNDWNWWLFFIWILKFKDWNPQFFDSEILKELKSTPVL